MAKNSWKIRDNDLLVMYLDHRHFYICIFEAYLNISRKPYIHDWKLFYTIKYILC